MNKELQFRVWDGQRYHYTVNNIGLGLSLVDLKNKCFIDKNLTAPLYFSKCKIEYYTGLKDKNNKEIYEGDIVKFVNNIDFGVFSVGIITWMAKSTEFGVKWIDCGVDDSLSWQTSCGKIIEVIGNIHENPELLGVSEDKINNEMEGVNK